MIHAWTRRQLVERVNMAALAGSKTDQEQARSDLDLFQQMLDGDPRMESPERLRETWGTGTAAERGQQAMLSMPGMAGFVLDDDGPHRVPNPGETPAEQARHEVNDIERDAGLPATPWDTPAG